MHDSDGSNEAVYDSENGEFFVDWFSSLKGRDDVRSNVGIE